MSEQQRDLFGEVVAKDILLRERFLEPPFSILDSKGGDWQNRKRAWKRKGIRSEEGRDVSAVPGAFGGELNEKGEDKYGRKPMSETSIFDPVLCELMYNWYCPAGGRILDPFAGGSVRGIVANYLGFKYTGIDIRPEQVESNRAQALEILPINNQPQWYIGDSNVVLDGFNKEDGEQQELYTPVELVGDIWVKRDDMFCAAGVRGGKVRSCLSLTRGAKGLVTAGSRKSPQVNIVASIAQAMGVPCYCHCPEGELGPELLSAQAKGAVIVQHKAGYNNVIIARAREDAEARGFLEVPFGMMYSGAVDETKVQVGNIPDGVQRIVVPVGSGMALAGILTGLAEIGRELPVVGVVMGADPEKTLDTFAPSNWREMCTLVPSGLDYHTEATNTMIGNIKLDPIYEAKCLPYLQSGDLFWVVGIREDVGAKNEYKDEYVVPVIKKEVTGKVQFDLVFSCPPYADLEVYSKLPGDISNMDYPQFMAMYRSIIQKSVKLLKRGGYAIFVVGDIRDKRGYYRDFVSHTKQAFIDAGALLYNEAILLQPLGTAMLRCAKIFEAGKKLTKVHENVLIFKKV